MRKKILWYKLEDKRLAAGLSQTDLAKAVGRTPQWVSKIEAGNTRTVDAKDLDKIAKALNIPLYELEFEVSSDPLLFPTPSGDEFYRLPVINDDGLTTYESTTIFPRVQLVKYFRNIQNLAVFHQQGESMSPTIDHGDDVIIDLSETMIKDDLAIYLFQNFAGDIVFLKRIHIRPQGGYVIKSDAGDIFTDMIITKEEAKEMKVIGKALGRFSIKTF